ncbi:Hypothetical protein POVN_LOCUS147 [uncultured virus]|nr:Hypothetical protein POVN_LOCUS147 [uncultured virus]
MTAQVVFTKAAGTLEQLTAESKGDKPTLVCMEVDKVAGVPTLERFYEAVSNYRLMSIGKLFVQDHKFVPIDMIYMTDPEVHHLYWFSCRDDLIYAKKDKGTQLYARRVAWPRYRKQSVPFVTEEKMTAPEFREQVRKLEDVAPAKRWEGFSQEYSADVHVLAFHTSIRKYIDDGGAMNLTDPHDVDKTLPLTQVCYFAFNEIQMPVRKRLDFWSLYWLPSEPEKVYVCAPGFGTLYSYKLP